MLTNKWKMSGLFCRWIRQVPLPSKLKNKGIPSQWFRWFIAGLCLSLKFLRRIRASPATPHAIYIRSMTLERHSMEPAYFTPVAFEWFFFKMNSIKVARNVSGIIKYLEANLSRKPFTYKALKAYLWLLSSLKAFPGRT